MAKTQQSPSDLVTLLKNSGLKGEARGHSQTELREMTGLGKIQVHERLLRLKAEGRLHVGRKIITALDGSQRSVPAYWIE